MTYAVFINQNGTLQIEEYNSFESDYYIYCDTLELCKKYCSVMENKFHTYTEFHNYLKNWCKEHDVDYCGCLTVYNDKMTEELLTKDIK